MPKANQSLDFAKQLKELEAIVEWFEAEDVDLGEALPKFERGMELTNRLRKHLGQVENKVEIIKKKFDQASPPKDRNLDGVIDDPPGLL